MRFFFKWKISPSSLLLLSSLLSLFPTYTFTSLLLSFFQTFIPLFLFFTPTFFPLDYNTSSLSLSRIHLTTISQ